MNEDSLYDFRTWPQAGRDQLETALLRGKERYLEKCITDPALSADLVKNLQKALAEVRQRLSKIAL